MRTTLGKFLRPGALALLLGAVPLAPAWAQMVLHMPSATQSAAPQQRALSLAVGEALRLENLSLDERNRNTATAELRRIAVTDKNTRFIVHTGDQTQDIAPPVRAHFTGQLVGEPNSSVFVSIDGDGAMRSIIDRAGEVFVNEVVPGADTRPALALSRRIDQESDFSGRTFSCGVTPRFIEESRKPASATLRQNLQSAAAQLNSSATKPHIAAAPSVQRRADLIIETDYELFQRLGGSSQVSAYVTDLFGYINTRYQSEAGARLNLQQINIYTTAADPWTRTSSSDQLNDLMAYWNTASRSAQARHHVHMLSAKDGGGGVAYLDTLYMPSYGYGVSTGIEGDFSATNPQIVWDAVEVAHEIGHAFGSDHTHEYDDPTLGSNAGGAIDCCASTSAGSQCAVNNGGAGRKGPFPGINSITGGVAGQRTGTIMSYCHTISPGMANVSFTFGTGHQYGVSPWRVADVLRTSAENHLPVDGTAPPVSYTLTVTPSGTGSGNVSSSPSGIQCGSDCSEAYTAGTAVTLTATPATGSTFGGWSGACSGTASTCSVSMNASSYVTAAFTQTSTTRVVTVTKSGSGSGSISSSPTGLSCAATGCTTASANFPSTTAITLTATAATGSTFGSWSGACSGSYSTCSLAAGTSALNVTATFNTSSGGGGTLTNPVLFVTQQYQDLFNRSPDAAGLNYWTNQLQSGAIGQAKLIETFMAQPDFKDRYGPLVRLYTAYFQRMPDYDGLMYWYGRMYPSNGTNGLLINNTSESFAQSAEFISIYGQLNNLQFVELVYQNVLGRMAEPGGRDYWVGRLNAGLIRGEMMIGFSESAENISNNRNANTITMAFAGMLRRVPSASERDAWLAAMNAGSQSTLTLIQAILDSSAYASRFP